MSKIETITENKTNYPVLKLRLVNNEKDINDTKEFINNIKSDFEHRSIIIKELNEALDNPDHRWHTRANIIVSTIDDVDNYSQHCSNNSNRLINHELINDNTILRFSLMTYQEIIVCLTKTNKELEHELNHTRKLNELLNNTMKKHENAIDAKEKENFIVRKKILHDNKNKSKPNLDYKNISKEEFSILIHKATLMR